MMRTTLLKKILLAALCALSVAPALAGPGHDHGDDHSASAVSANGPQRLPDGSVFLPKPSQRQLALRTMIVERKALPQAFTLTGTVVTDPNAAGIVQPTVAGRIEAGPRGLPSLGQTVRRGEVLAYVRPSAGTIERANQAAQAAELRAARMLAEQRLARLLQLEGTVPQKEIDAARAELHGLNERSSAIAASLSTREALLAPVAGVIATADVVTGQVVDAREALFRIIDPNRLRVEAIAHDAAVAGNIASASAGIEGGATLALEFIGAGRVLREQAVPVQFRIQALKDTPLAVGQPLKIVAQSKSTVDGVAIPASAIVKNPGNQDIVWVHAGAERFVPKAVRHVPLDAGTVTVVDGLNGGERVVVQSAPLVNQVR